MYWINDLDNRKFITRLGFVLVTLGLLGYLNHINVDGEFKELIVGIIGIFIGVASIAAKELISGNAENELKSLQDSAREEVSSLKDRVNSLELRLAESEKEREIYKGMIAELHEKLIDKSNFFEDKK